MRNLKKKRQKRQQKRLTKREKNLDLKRHQLNVNGVRSVKSAKRKRECGRSKTKKEKLKLIPRNNKSTWTTSSKKPGDNT